MIPRGGWLIEVRPDDLAYISIDLIIQGFIQSRAITQFDGGMQPMKTMYYGIPFSPQAALTDNIGAADTIIKVSDVSAFPDAPNYATIGTDEDGETISTPQGPATALSGCTRVEGLHASPGTAGELIGRNFTPRRIAALIDNVEEAAKNAEADGVTFDDGETFQEKYNSGELKGPQGRAGEQGPTGPGANEIVVALPGSGWSNGAQTVQNAGLVVSGYRVYHHPRPDSYGAIPPLP